MIFLGVSILESYFLQSWLHVQLFFPLLAIFALRLSKPKALWMAALSGVCLDLLTISGGLGLHATIFSLIMMALYPYKRFFFEEKWLHFSLYAALFGVLSTILLAFACACGKAQFSCSIPFIAIDVLLLPICDAVFGWLIFVMPKTLFRFLKRFVVEWRWRLRST
jgi:rod shape-determining protein MreD